MMKALALLGATALLMSAAPPAPDVPDASIGVIRCGDRLGTAFRVSPTRLISAAHVTSRETACTAIESGEILQVVREDGAMDVAELRAAPAPGALTMECGGFRRGAAYRAIGFIQGSLRANLPLLATGLSDTNGQAEFIGETHPGMSGGPVIDQRGRVVGVVNMRLPARSRALQDTFACRR